ncbi:MAG: hypothetical protein GEV12_14930 [Micromonosporaceae bacterium]|nr:hypothetical protein [Micromonosporaceae bacterium]
MAPEPEDDKSRDAAARDADEAARRVAQDSVAELARMGIDPRALGLEPQPAPGAGVPPVGHPATPPPPATAAGRARPRSPARGVATPPAAARSSPPAGYRPASPRPATIQPAPAPAPTAAPPTAPPPPPTMPPAPGPPPGARPPLPPPPGPGAPPAAYRIAPPAAARPKPGLEPEPEPEWLTSTLSRSIVAVPQPSAAASGGPAAPLERLLAAPAPALAPPGRWRQAVRAATLGLLEPQAAAAVEQERVLVARVRVRRPEPRLIAFLGGKGGVGTSTAAAGVALTLASLRGDTTALVSARSGAGSLGQRLLGQPAPPVPALVDGEPAPPPLWVHDHLAVVDGSPWHSPTPRDSLLKLLEQLRSQHPLTIVDVGNDLGEPAEAALGRADQIVLVTGASQDALAATRTALSRVHQIDPFRLGTVVVALTCLSERQYRRTAHRLRTELGLQSARVVPIGFDPWLAAGDRIDPARMRVTTRQAYLQIAGMVADPGRSEQWFAQPPGAGAPA